MLTTVTMALIFSFSMLIPSASAAELPALDPISTGLYYDDWITFGNQSDKVMAISDSDSTTGVTRESNSKFQDFLFIPSIPITGDITKVIFQVDAIRNGDNTNSLNLGIISGTNNPNWYFGENILISNAGIVTVEEVFTTNPLTGDPWTVEEINTGVSNGKQFAFAIDQQTKQKSSKIDVSEIRLILFIEDITPPIIITPADIYLVEATAQYTPVNLGEASATDNVDGVIDPTEITNDAPLDGFPVGTTTVTWSASDSSGNIGTAIQSVEIVDTIPPVFVTANDAPLASGEANVDGTNIAYGPILIDDIADPNPIVICSPVSPALVTYAPDSTGIDSQDISCDAVDASGNESSETYIIEVHDTQIPEWNNVATEPKHWLFEDPFTVGVDDEPPTAYDDAEGDLSVTITPTSLQNTVGVQTLTYSADDLSTLSTPALSDETRDINIITINFSDDLIAGQIVDLSIEDQIASNAGETIIATLSVDDGNGGISAVPVTLEYVSGFKFSAMVQLTASPPLEIDAVGGSCPDGYSLDIDNNDNCILDSDVTYLDVDTTGDVVTVEYRDFAKTFNSSEFGANPDAFGGAATNPNDPIRFAESDAYYIGSTATLRVTDDAFIGDSIPLVISSSDGDVELLNAIRIPGTDLFETSGITIVSAGDAVNVIISPVGTTISVTYNAFTAVANVIADPSVMLNTISVDTTRVEVCIAGDSNTGPDTDLDGICDFWEYPNAGKDSATGLYDLGLKIPTNTPGVFYELICDPAATLSDDPSGATVCSDVNRPDLYVELDSMVGHTPSPTAINDVVAAFDNSFVRNSFGVVVGVTAHIMIDDVDVEHHNQIDFSSSLDAPSFLQLKSANFGNEDDRNDSNASEILTAQRQVVRYGLYIHDQLNNVGSSGLAENPGNDFLVSLGSYTAFQGSEGQQSGTLMHEIGHTLGLNHGGQDLLQCKPNYLSVMNYLYQFVDGDGGLIDRPLDYSRSLYTSIDESNLVDGFKVIGGTTRTMVFGGVDSNGIPVDLSEFDAGSNGGRRSIGTAESITWNPNAINVHYFTGIAGCQDTSTTILNSQDDWGAINFNFRNTNGFASGIIYLDASDENESIDIDNPDGTDDDTFGVHNLIVTDMEINENQMYVPEITIVDPHQDSWTVTFDYGEIDDNDPLNSEDQVTIENFEFGVDIPEIDHIYADDGVYTVTVTVDNGFAILTRTLTVTVNNVSPIFEILGIVTGYEGSPIVHTGGSILFATVDNPPLSFLSVDYGDDTLIENVVLTNLSGDSLITTADFTLTHTYDTADDYTITFTANDGDTVLVNALLDVTIDIAYDGIQASSPLINSQYEINRNIPLKFNVINTVDGVDTFVETATPPEIFIFNNGELVEATTKGSGKVGNLAEFNISTLEYTYQINTKKLEVDLATFIEIHIDNGQIFSVGPIELK